jgi:superfamily II DNA/RNA helicase
LSQTLKKGLNANQVPPSAVYPATLSSGMLFSELGLQSAMLDAVAELGYKEPTPIQAGAIPRILEGRDVIGSAQTGTGKTAAFALPILSQLGSHAPGPRCLVLEPTRELAVQTYENFEKFAKFTNLRIGLIYGGVGYGKQRDDLKRGMDVIVATPGRLLDHLGEGAVRLEGVKFLVLDEADRMLDMGFLPDVRRIVLKCGKDRQSSLFSATIPPAIETLITWAMRDPVTIEIGARRSVADTVKHVLYPVAELQKPALLVSLLERVQWESAIVFCRTRRDADSVDSLLRRNNHKAAVIHSDRSQKEREQSLEGFKSGRYEVLVATDIAARGLDIADVSHVINYNVPEHPEDYVHRIGRTGRAMSSGDALTLFCAGEAAQVASIERYIGKKVERVKLPDFPYTYTALFDEDKLGPATGRKTLGARVGKGYFFGPSRRR